MSLTLGGYDENRFVPNNVSFTLNPSMNPEVYISSITTTDGNGTTTELVNAAAKISAVIDSSTPYLWLPAWSCQHFADYFGLTYNETLNLYVYNSTAQHDMLAASGSTFLFSLSDVSASPELVNITLPFAAFDLKLTFPAIEGTDPGDSDSTMAYFPLRQATSDDQYTIGRAFLQEAYIITNYETNAFSLHQAVHTLSPLTNTSIVAIDHLSTSDLLGPPVINGKKLSTGVIAGISVSAVAGTAIMTIAVLYICRRSRRRSRRSGKKSAEDDKSSILSLSIRLAFMDRLRRRGPPPTHEASGDIIYPAEVGACAEHERFELPAPLGPVELDSEDGTLDGNTEQGSSTQDSNNLSEYERARRKLEMQQIAAAKAQQTLETYPDEKSEPMVSQDVSYGTDIESLLVSPIGDFSGGSLTLSSNGASSPVSPGFMETPVSPLTSVPPPIYQRFNSSNVVYAGRLPNNVQLPQIVPTFEGTHARTVDETAISDQDAYSLGSQFTEHEEDLYGTGSPIALSNPSDDSRSNMQTLRSESGRLTHSGSTRRLDGEDLIHVPQVAENRFSWEEERTEGTD
jgi:hypothetical protein